MAQEGKYTLVLKLGGLTVEVNTNYQRYFNYLNTYFDKVAVAAGAKIQPHIRVDASWQDSSFNKNFSSLKKSLDSFAIGPSTFVADNRVVTIRKVDKRKKILFDSRIEGESFYASAVFHRKIYKDMFRYLILGKAEEELFFTITYPILYYPVFWYLEYFKNAYALHASAVKFAGTGVVFCGLEGIGKTSLALSLLDEKDSYFLSDNLVFCDDKKVYPCYELTRLHKGESHKLWKGKFEKVNKFKTAKDYYSPVLVEGLDDIEPKVIIFPQFSSKFAVKEISRLEAVNKAIILSSIPAELNNYSEYRNLYNWLVPGFVAEKAHRETLSRLFENTRCYEVGMSKTEGLENNAKKVKDIVKNGI